MFMKWFFCSLLLTVQILEDRSAATAIKEEGNENDPWNRREGKRIGKQRGFIHFSG